MKKWMNLAAAALLLSACDPKAGSPAEWSGRWNGPEGTYLELTPQGEALTVTIADLDGPQSFEGKYDAGTVLFTRNDVQETIRSGTGKETGMKWLLDKQNCLIVKEGEGYCRD